MRITTLIGLIAAAVMGTQPATAQSPGAPVVVLDGGPSSRPWSAVGRLTLDGQFVCTATLVAPTVILTAAHCVLDDDGLAYPARRLGFQAGVKGDAAVLVRDVAAVRPHPEYRTARFASVERTASDIAMLDLAWPVTEYEILPIPIGGYKGERRGLLLPNYAEGNESFLRIDRGCDVLAQNGAVLELGCTPREGASGAPLITGVGPGRRVVGVLSNASRGFNPRGYAARLDYALPGLAGRPRSSATTRP